MPTKTMNVGLDAYNALLGAKAAGESFTDVILRLAKPRASLLDLAGTLSEAQAEALWGSVAEGRARSAHRRAVMDRAFAERR